MQHILSLEARDHAIECYQQTLKIGEEIVALGANVSAFIAKQNALVDKFHEHEAAKPTETVETADALADALAADPEAVDTKALARLRTGQVAAKDALAAWQDRKDVIHLANTKLIEQIEATRAGVGELEREKSRAMMHFLNVTSEAMCKELQERFDQFYQEVLGPIAALAEVTWTTGAPFFDGGNSLLRFRTNVSPTYAGGPSSFYNHLFPKYPGEANKNSLNQHYHTLRNGLGEALIAQSRGDASKMALGS